MTKGATIIVAVLNKMFKIAKIDMTFDRLLKYQKKHPRWYSDWTWTQKQEDAWEKWAVSFIARKGRMSKFRAKSEFAWISLSWGLRVRDE